MERYEFNRGMDYADIVAASERVARPIGLVSDLFYVCAPTPLQWGIARALEIGEEYYAKLAADYQKKRDMLAEALRAAGFVPFVPQGAYYMLAKIPDGFRTGTEAASALIENAGVAAVPGAAFYTSGGGDSLLRFCFAKRDQTLGRAAERLVRV